METKFYHLQKLCLAFLREKMPNVAVELLKKNEHKKGIVSLIEVGYPFGTKINPYVEGPFFEQVELLIVVSTRPHSEDKEPALHALANQVVQVLHGWAPDLDGLGSPFRYCPAMTITTEKDPLPMEMAIVQFVTSLDGPVAIL